MCWWSFGNVCLCETIWKNISASFDKISMIRQPWYKEQLVHDDKWSQMHVQLTGAMVWNNIQKWHDDVIKWKLFPGHWPFVKGIHRWPVDSPHKGQWRGALMFSLVCAWKNGWVNNRDAGDLRRHRAHYDVTVMIGLTGNMQIIQLSRWWWSSLSAPKEIFGYLTTTNLAKLEYHVYFLGCPSVVKTSLKVSLAESDSVVLTHLGRVTHIWVSKLTIIDSDTGLSPDRRQAIIWINAGILLIWHLGKNFNENSIKIHTFLFTKIHLKISSGLWPFFSASMCW